MKSRFALVLIAVIAVSNMLAFCIGHRMNLATVHQAEDLVTKYYAVEDLVTRWRGQGANDEPDFETLVSLLQSQVAPDTWDNGRTFTPIPSNRLLAVTNSAEVQGQISALLSKLREPVEHYQKCVNDNVCMHCRATPMPQTGTSCTNCGCVRCEPRFDAPRLAAIP